MVALGRLDSQVVLCPPRRRSIASVTLEDDTEVSVSGKAAPLRNVEHRQGRPPQEFFRTLDSSAQQIAVRRKSG